MLTPATAHLQSVIQYIERHLAMFYGLTLQTSVIHHLVCQRDIINHLGSEAVTLPEFSGRAGVWLKQDYEDELFIGLHLDQDLTDQLLVDPCVTLSQINLDAFCILVEEISHFHLLIDRLTSARGVSKLELEWQGEIDKLLLAAITFKQQTGDWHIEPLIKKLFDTAVIIAKDQMLYEQASQHAARFWHVILDDTSLNKTEKIGPWVQRFLRENYKVNWSEKLSNLNKLYFKRAS